MHRPKEFTKLAQCIQRSEFIIRRSRGKLYKSLSFNVSTVKLNKGQSSFISNIFFPMVNYLRPKKNKTKVHSVGGPMKKFFLFLFFIR